MSKLASIARIGGLGLALTATTAFAGPTLDTIQSRGELQCGVSTGTSIGKSFLDDTGKWSGFEVEFCRAVAAAILGDPEKVDFVPLEFRNAFTALSAANVDLLARSATWTYSRDSDLGLDWAGVYLYDGQGFLVSRDAGIDNVAGLDGAAICVTAGTTTELNLADYFRGNGIGYTPIVVNSPDQSTANLEAGRCDAYTNEVGSLAAYRLGLGEPDNFVLLPDVISREPLGPVVRQDDPHFRDLVAWTLHALVIAELHGVTQDNVAELAKTSDNPELRRLFGAEGEFGAMMGLPNEWAVAAVSAVGNYGELFERTLGMQSPVDMARGQNRLWTDGGLLFAPPVR